MIFINPKTDFAFKRIFGSEESKDILISFLNALLYQGYSRIEDLEILNPYLAPRIRGVKDTYLGVKARLKTGESVIIEIQVLNIEGFEKRILYNAAKAYSIQLDIRDNYTRLNPVIALTITDFTIFPQFEKLISRFALKETEYLFDYSVYDIELVFVELPKFSKSLEELEDVEHREIFIHDQRNTILKAVKQRLEQGLEQGLEQCKKEAQIEIARQLLDTLDEEIISQKTGLTLEEVLQLKEEFSS